MTLPVPDTSPAMLRVFLRARIKSRQSTYREKLYAATREISRVVRRDAGVSAKQFDAALAGRADDDVVARIWAAIGVEVNDA